MMCLKGATVVICIQILYRYFELLIRCISLRHMEINALSKAFISI